MKLHSVMLTSGDTLKIEFAGMSALDFSTSFEQLLELALQAKLQEIHKNRFDRENQANLGLNAATQIEKRW